MSAIANIVEKLEQIYDDFNSDSIDQLEQLYCHDVNFTDPIHQVQGIDALKAYFKSSMNGVNYCHFAFAERARQGDTVFVSWQMRLQHPKLAEGKEIILPGVSQLTLRDDKIVQQIDFYDAGAMLYEHIPLLRFVIKKVKQRVTS